MTGIIKLHMSHFITETCHLYIGHLSKVGRAQPQPNIYNVIWFMNNAMTLFINKNNEKLMFYIKIIYLVNIGCNYSLKKYFFYCR